VGVRVSMVVRGGAGKYLTVLRKGFGDALADIFPRSLEESQLRTGRKWVRKSLSGPGLVSYYPKSLRDNLVRTREEVIAARKYDVMLRLGKTSPKKGAKYKGKK